MKDIGETPINTKASVEKSEGVEILVKNDKLKQMKGWLLGDLSGGK